MRVLIVDDSPTVRLSLTRMLERLQHEVTAVGSSEEALELVAAGFAADAVFTDNHMPGASGMELIRSLRLLSAYRSRPILLLSADSAEELRRDARAARASGWLSKPVGFAQLRAVMGRIGAARIRAEGLS